MAQKIFTSKKSKSRILIVPWRNKEEWMETYQQAYSEDLELQQKAYRRMCIWKIRHPNLPMGVECSMSMLRVRLFDKKAEDNTTEHMYEDKELQLLYGTAIMRFLNHLSIISGCKNSMYKMAQKQNIPAWLINLRHEAAHGNNLPALYLLREASDIIMQWLKTQYWEIEAEVMEDVNVDAVAEKKQVTNNIKELLDLWIILKFEHWSGRKTIDNIEEADIREKATEMATQEGLRLKRSAVTPIIRKGAKKLKMTNETATSSTTADCQEYTHKIRTSFEPLLKKLLHPLKDKKHKNQYGYCLIEALVKHAGFCPKLEIKDLSEPNILILMSLLGELWKEVIQSLQAHSLLGHLILKLSAHDESSKHLWLRLLTHLLSGDAPVQPQGSREVCSLLANSLPFSVDSQVLFIRANFNHVKQHKRLELKPASGLEVYALRHVAQDILENPIIINKKYFRSLLAFWEKPLSEETKEHLCLLVNIYCGQKIHKRVWSKGFNASVSIKPFEFIDVSVKKTDDVSSKWKLYEGDADWRSCPLGSLPWQH